MVAVPTRQVRAVGTSLTDWPTERKATCQIIRAIVIDAIGLSLPFRLAPPHEKVQKTRLSSGFKFERIPLIRNVLR
jgi:hypothetical protein